MGLCICKVQPFVSEVLILLTQQTVKFLFYKYRGVGTSDVSIRHKPGANEHRAIPRDGRSTGTQLLWNLPCGSARMNLSLWFIHLRNWNQIFISLAVTPLQFGFLEKPACSSWSNEGITGNHTLNKMFF